MRKVSGSLKSVSRKRYNKAWVGISAVLAVAISGVYYLNQSRAATVKYVTVTGSDSNPGTQAAPYRTVNKALRSLSAGDTLMVGGGTYAEDVTSLTISGTASSRITVKNINGERPVISGLFWFTGNYVTFDGINVTWRNGVSVDSHMMKFNGGTGWRWTNSEIWGSKSYANILIAGSPNQWSIDNNRIHNADGVSHTDVQDHNIYINTTKSSNTGIIERNLIYNAPRGQNIKFDGPGGGTGGGMNITVRYNTMHNSNRGMLIGSESQNNNIHNNIISTNSIGFYIYKLTGTGNKLNNNIFYGSGTYKQVSGSASGVSDTENAWGTINPQLDASLRPQNSAAANYGYYAPGGTTAPTPPTPTPPVPTPTPPTPTPTPPTPTPPSPPAALAPYKGITAQIAGKIEFENFDEGGEGVAYHDSDTSSTTGEVYRTGVGVDFRNRTTASNGWTITTTKTGEWLKYTVNVNQAGTYKVMAKAANTATGGSIRLDLDGAPLSGGVISIPNTGSFGTFADSAAATVTLPAGKHILTVHTVAATDAEAGSLDYLQFDAVASPPTGLPGDANGDSRVNALDLSILIAHDGQNHPAADFNGDGVVGAGDMAILLSRWTW